MQSLMSLKDVIRRFVGDPAGGGAIHELLVLLRHHRKLLRSPLECAPPDIADRRALERNDLGSHLTEADIAAVKALSDELQVNEKDCLRYYLAAPAAAREQFFEGAVDHVSRARRYHYYERHLVLWSLDNLVQGRDDANLCAEKKERLILHTNDNLLTGPGALPSSLMAGIRTLTQDAKAARNRDAVKYERALRDREHMARILFYLFVSTQIEVEELRALVDLIKDMSDEVYLSAHHDDKNPTYGVVNTLLMVLLAAVDFLRPRLDRYSDRSTESLEKRTAENARLAAAIASDSAVEDGFLNSFKPSMTTWKHTGVQAAVCIIWGFFYYGIDRANEGPAGYGPALPIGPVGDGLLSRTEVISNLLRYGMAYQGIHYLSCMLASGSVRHSPCRGWWVVLLHDMMVEIIRFDLTAGLGTQLVMRTRARQREQATRRGHGGSHHRRREAAVRPEDCLEDVLVFLSQLCRADPEFCTQYWAKAWDGPSGEAFLVSSPDVVEWPLKGFLQRVGAQMQESEAFLMLYWNLLATLSRGPACSDGKPCAHHCFNFVHGEVGAGAPESSATSLTTAMPSSSRSRHSFHVETTRQCPPPATLANVFFTLQYYRDRLDPEAQARSARTAAHQAQMAGGPGVAPVVDPGASVALTDTEVDVLEAALRFVGALASGGKTIRAELVSNASWKAAPTLFSLVRQRLPVSLKGTIFEVLASLVRDPDTAVDYWEQLEQAQVLTTVPVAGGRPAPAPHALGSALGRGGGATRGAPIVHSSAAAGVGSSSGILDELEHLETKMQTYPATLGFVALLRALFVNGAHVQLGAAYRVPGVSPHVRFMVDHVFTKASQRQYRQGAYGERWKVSAACLATMHDILASYRVFFPPPDALYPSAAAGGVASLSSPRAGGAGGGRGVSAAVGDSIGPPVGGNPAFDFSDSLPPVRVSSQASQPPAKSAAYMLLHEILTGGDLLTRLLEVLVYDGGVESLKRERAASREPQEDDAAPRDTRHDRHTAPAGMGMGLHGGAAASAPATVIAGIRATGGAITLTPEQKEALATVAREADASATEAALLASTGQQDDWLVWREKAVMLALAVLDAVMLRDGPFVHAARACGHGGSLHHLSEMIVRHRGVLPALCKYAGYVDDARIQLMAARVVYRLALSDASPTASQDLTIHLQGAPEQEIVAAFAACISLPDCGDDLGDEREEALAAAAAGRFDTSTDAAIDNNMFGVGLDMLSHGDSDGRGWGSQAVLVAPFDPEVVSRRRGTVLELLLRLAERTDGGLHVGHLFLGLQRVLETGAVSSTPAVLDVATRNCLAAVLELLGSPDLPGRRPSVAEGCYNLLYALVKDDRVSAAVFDYLQQRSMRVDGDHRRFFVAHLVDMPVVGFIAPPPGAGVAPPQGVAVSPATYASLVSQRLVSHRSMCAWLLKGIAVDLHTMANQKPPATPQIKAVLDELFTQPAGTGVDAWGTTVLADGSTGDERWPDEQRRCRMLELLAALQLSDAGPGVEPAFLRGEMAAYELAIDAKEGSGSAGVTVTIGGKPHHVYDIPVLRAVLEGADTTDGTTVSDRGTARTHSAAAAPAAASPVVVEGLEWAQRYNDYILQLHASHLLLEAWREVLCVSFQDCLPLLFAAVAEGADASTQSGGEALLFTLLEELLNKLAQEGGAGSGGGVPAPISEQLAETVLFLASKLREHSATLRLSNYQCKTVVWQMSQEILRRGGSLESGLGTSSTPRGRAMLYAALIQLLHYADGTPAVDQEAGLIMGRDLNATVGPLPYATPGGPAPRGDVWPPPEATNPWGVRPQHPAEDHAEMVAQAQAGVAEALAEVEIGDNLVTTLAQDVVKADASWIRCLSLLALVTLLSRDTRERWLSRLRSDGHLKAILHSLVDIDTVEADAEAYLASARSSAARASSDTALLDPVASVSLDRSKSRRAGYATGLEAVEGLLDTGRGPLAQESLALVHSLLPHHAVVPGAAAATSTALQTLPAAFQATLTLLIRIASSSNGCEALVQYGCIPMLSTLRWLTRQASAAAGAAGGIFPDEASASLSRSLAPRLEPILRLLSTMIGSRPGDARVAHDALQFVTRHASLLRTQFQAALSPSCTLTTLRLLGLITGLLARVGMVLPAAASGELATFDMDVLAVLRQGFAQQPRAHTYARKHSEELVRPLASAAAKDSCRWMQSMAPSNPKEEQMDAYPMMHGAVACVIVTAYDAAVARAGETLTSNLLAYCRLRLQGDGGRAEPAGETLFVGHAEGSSAPSAKPTIALLLAAVDDTAAALTSARATVTQLAESRHTVPPHTMPVLNRAMRYSQDACKTLEYTLESGMYLWYGHVTRNSAFLPRRAALKEFYLRHKAVVESMAFVQAMLRHLDRLVLE